MHNLKHFTLPFGYVVSNYWDVTRNILYLTLVGYAPHITFRGVNYYSLPQGKYPLKMSESCLFSALQGGCILASTCGQCLEGSVPQYTIEQYQESGASIVHRKH